MTIPVLHGPAADFGWLRGRFDDLCRRLPEVRAAQCERVVRWRWASSDATLERPEPLFAQRDGLRGPGRLIAPVGEDRSVERDGATTWGDSRAGGYPSHGTRYGLAEDGSFLLARSMWRENIGEHLIWSENVEGQCERAFVASITHRAELYALAVVDLVDGRAVRSLYRNALFEGEERYVWEGEKVRAIVSRETQIAQANTVSLEAWRASYLPDGRSESLVYSDAHIFPRVKIRADHVGRSVLGEDPWRDVAAWFEDERTQWRSRWDWRVDQPEDKAPLSEVLDGLAEELAELLFRCAEEAVRSRALVRPFIINYPGHRGGRRAWLNATIAVESLRERAREVKVKNVSAVVASFYAGLSLDLLPLASARTLRQVRQLTQIDQRSSLEHWPGEPTYRDIDDGLKAFRLDLVAATNARRLSTAAEDFLVLGDRQETGEVLGRDRMAAFEAAGTPPPSPAIRIGKITGPEAIERFAERLGLAEQAAQIAAQARWAHELIPAPADAIGATRVGGLAPLPPGMPWPTWEERPLSFLALIDLGEIPPLPDNPPGELSPPNAGVLLFFADLVDWTGEPESARPGNAVRVIAVEDARGVPTAPPAPTAWSEINDCEIELPTLNPVPMAFRPRLTLPAPMGDLDYWGNTVYETLVERVNRAQGRRVLRTQWLGHPVDSIPDPPEENQHLLLGLNHDPRSGFMFADGGGIHYTATTTQAIREGDWNEITATGMSG